VTTTGYLTVVCFDLKEGQQRRSVIEAARQLGLRVETWNSEQFSVYVNEAMDAYRLGIETAVILMAGRVL
jgi:hypothetical protein